MGEFNTSGPCNPELHYTVPRTDVVARGLEHIERGHYFTMTEKIDKNVSNIVNKARQQRDLMLRMLFNGDVPFHAQDAAVSFLHVNGVVANVDGVADVPVPLYKKCLVSALQPVINGETQHYTTVRTDFDAYLDGEDLNLPALLEA